MSRLRSLGLHKTKIEYILQTFHNPLLDIRQCGRIYHHLKNVEAEVIPQAVSPLSPPSSLFSPLSPPFVQEIIDATSQPVHEAKLSNSAILYYHKPTEIVQLLMSDPNISDRMAWEWNYNNGVIEELWHTDYWLDLLAHFWDFVLKEY